MSITKDEKSTKSVATINNQQIVIVSENGEDFVPIRPICDALGIEFSSQLKRLKRDEILNSTVVTVTTVGADEKQREMIAIPYRYVFGWLFTIDANQVRPEAREAVLAYQMQCYDALYDHFTVYADFVAYRAEQIEHAINIKAAVRLDFNTAKDRLKDATDMEREALAINFDSYMESRSQTSLNFDDMEGGAS
jgi:hypothetical protein